MSKPLHINEDELDTLLNNYILKFSPEEFSRVVFETSYFVNVDPDKESTMLKRLEKDLKGGGGWNLFYTLLVGVLIGSVILFFYLYQNQKNTSSVSISRSGSNKSIDPPTNNLTFPDKKTTIEKDAIKIIDTFSNEKRVELLSAGIPGDIYAAPSLPRVIAPALLFTNEQILFFEKIKKKVLDKLLGISTDLYTKVEEGKVAYKSGSIDVDPFVIRNFAITNLEYKVFLAELQVAGRTADLEKCLVHTKMWLDQNCPVLAADYFSAEKYNGFPVVNISYEAALLFCDWLEQEMNRRLQSKKAKRKKVTVRLPYDYEWFNAAKIGYVMIPNCAGYNTIYDASEGLVDKSFLKRMALIRSKDKTVSTPMDKLVEINRYGMNENEILKIFEESFRYSDNTYQDSLYPKGLDIFSKAAHVSEMIRNTNGQMVIMGSCWGSKQEYLTMLKDFTASGASTVVGFRIVIVNSSKGSYKDPFW